MLMINQRKVQSTLTIKKIPIIVLHFCEKKVKILKSYKDFRDVNSQAGAQ